MLTEGEEARVLHATQELITLGLAKPILIGRPSVIEMRIQKLGLQIKAGVDFEIVNNESDPRFKEYWSEYYQIMKRRGITRGAGAACGNCQHHGDRRDHGAARRSGCNDLRYDWRLP